MLYYVNSVNDRRWFGWYKKTVKCASITGNLQLKLVNGRIRKYWKVQYAFHFIYKANMGNGLTEHEFDHVFIGHFHHHIEFQMLAYTLFL